jgi:hypothetical protein
MPFITDTAMQKSRQSSEISRRARTQLRPARAATRANSATARPPFDPRRRSSLAPCLLSTTDELRTLRAELGFSDIQTLLIKLWRQLSIAASVISSLCFFDGHEALLGRLCLRRPSPGTQRNAGCEAGARSPLLTPETPAGSSLLGALCSSRSTDKTLSASERSW